jgi:hypothetical protein
MPADQYLSCQVEGDELVFRIGIDTLAYASDESDLFKPFDEDINDFVPKWKVIDATGWAKDIAHEMNDEDEIGGSPLIYFLEKMFEKALDQGSTSLWSSEDEE